MTSWQISKSKTQIPNQFQNPKLKFQIKTAIIALLILTILPLSVLAQDESQRLSELTKQIQDLERKVYETRNRAVTLSNQIIYMDNQIKLASLKISETESKIEVLEKEIEELTKKIFRLEGSLSKISEVLIGRVAATYKTAQVSPLWLLFSSDGFSQMLSRAKYLRLVQTHDKKLMFQVQSTKTDFEDQKKLLEEKKEELDSLKKKLESQKLSLDQQKKDKQTLLEATRSDEKKYQEMLAAARAEQAAIEAAMKKALLELKDGTPIEGGKEIALIGNTGAPGCSTGPHLHLEITKEGIRQSPADYLKSRDVAWDNSPDGQFSFNGSWDWPIGSPRITQGYGMTYWARTGFYGGSPHFGLDMTSDSPVIKAPKNGTLYRGSTTCRGSGMNYVAIDHGEGLISWYWHVQ